MNRNAAEDIQNENENNNNNKLNNHSSRQDEINNISAGVFRRENNQQQQPQHFHSVHLNEYFARNLNMAKLASPTTVHDKMTQSRSGSPSSSSIRQMLPIALCLFTFASVLSMLIIYIDTTEIRHQQFRLNMSRDYDLQGISQDNPVLVSYLREIHLQKYVQEPLFQQHSPSPLNDEGKSSSTTTISRSTAANAEYLVNELLGGQRTGSFIQSAIGTSSDSLMIAPYLIERFAWRGLIVEPDPKKFFGYGRTYGGRKDVHVIHACFSPTGYPKEVTLHQEGLDGEGEDGSSGSERREEVKISSVLDGEEEDASEWFENRVKCFSLFTLMLAANQTEVDLLSLSLHGLELQILKTVPFERVRVNVISLHFANGEDGRAGYIQTVTRFLTARGFKLMRVVGHSYFYKAKRAMKRMAGGK